MACSISARARIAVFTWGSVRIPGSTMLLWTRTRQVWASPSEAACRTQK
jgi:hypothetical protein